MYVQSFVILSDAVKNLTPAHRNDTNSCCSRHLEPEVQKRYGKMLVIVMKPKSENTKAIIKETRPLREKTCFDQKQGNPYKMAEKSAILKVIIMKLYTPIDKAFVNVNSNFEHFRLNNVIFVIFFLCF